VQLKVLRDAKEITLPLTVGEMKENEVVASAQEGELGLAVEPITPQLAERMGLDRRDGLVVTEVKPGSAADEAGLQAGDLITQINRRPVKNLADYKREMAASEKGSVLFLVRRGDNSVFLALKR
jgi:serine protease Do